MNTDSLLIILGWLISIVLLITFVPKAKIRQASLIFLIKQAITWFTGLLVVELRLIEYPVRSFHYATKSSFDFEYFIYPAFCVLFNLYYPEGKSFAKRFLHFIYYCSALTAVEVVVEKYTNILTYLHWAWFITFITFFITFLMSHLFYKWFFKIYDK